MVNSVNTNAGAIVALQSLNRTNADLDKVQKRVSTGYRVADASDDGAAFSVAQGLRADVKGNEAVIERLGSAKGLVGVASSALSSISDTVGEARKVLVKLSDSNLSTDERTQYETDYKSLQAEIGNFVTQAAYNGTNLLSGTTVNKTIFDSSGAVYTLTAQDIAASATTNLSTVSNITNAQAVLTGGLATFEAAVGKSLSTLGSWNRAITSQSSFLSIVNDATEQGIGSIVDADLAKESAKLQSLQIRQQLGAQALSIANQAPSILVSLFR